MISRYSQANQRKGLGLDSTGYSCITDLIIPIARLPWIVEAKRIIA